MNKKVILPIYVTPEIREIHTSAYIISMLHSHKNYSDDWLLKYCIKTIFTESYQGVLTYKISPIWYIKYFKSRIILFCKKNKFIEVVRKKIDEGYYCIVCVNEFYIPNRISYKKKYFEHDILLYGYDNKKSCFYSIAYNMNGEYKTDTVSFENIESAFFSHREHNYKFYALKPKPRLSFNVKSNQIIKSLIWFNKKSHKTTGINAYYCLKNKTRLDLNNNDSIDIRSFRTIVERASVLCGLSDFFNFPLSMSNNLIMHRNHAESLFYLSLKYNICKDERNKDSLISFLNKFITEEQALTIEILKILSN